MFRRKLPLLERQVILYGISMAALLLFLNWIELRFVLISHAFEVYVGAIALVFTFLGIWLAKKLARPEKEVRIIEKPVYVKEGEFVLNEKAVAELGLSRRELEVLSLMATGLSNQEIAGRLFVSLNTVKTHSARIFEKLGAERRTQAVDVGKRMGIIP